MKFAPNIKVHSGPIVIGIELLLNGQGRVVVINI